MKDEKGNLVEVEAEHYDEEARKRRDRRGIPPVLPEDEKAKEPKKGMSTGLKIGLGILAFVALAVVATALLVLFPPAGLAGFTVFGVGVGAAIASIPTTAAIAAAVGGTAVAVGATGAVIAGSGKDKTVATGKEESLAPDAPRGKKPAVSHEQALGLGKNSGKYDVKQVKRGSTPDSPGKQTSREI